MKRIIYFFLILLVLSLSSCWVRWPFGPLPMDRNPLNSGTNPSNPGSTESVWKLVATFNGSGGTKSTELYNIDTSICRIDWIKNKDYLAIIAMDSFNNTKNVFSAGESDYSGTHYIYNIHGTFYFEISSDGHYSIAVYEEVDE